MELKYFKVIMPYEELKKYYKKYGIKAGLVSSKECITKLIIALKTIFGVNYVGGCDSPSDIAFIFNIEYKPGIENISLKDTGFYFVPEDSNVAQVMEDLYGSKQ